MRGAACFGYTEVVFTGRRFDLNDSRLPREERLRAYRSVSWRRSDRPFDELPPGTVPVAVEIAPGAELLPGFEHPENAAYVFGPEDGSLPRGVMGQCHRFIRIPTNHCLNLGVAVNVVLYDRSIKVPSASRTL